MQEQNFNLNDWYTVQEATDKLNQNKRTAKSVSTDYVRSLARYKKIQVYKLGNASLYRKADVDAYIVEAPGKKSGRAKQQKSTKPLS